MFTADAAFVFEDLRQQGLLTTIQVERTVATARNARGHRAGTRTPIGEPVAVYIAAGASGLLAAAFGERIQAGLSAVCPPGLDVQPDDELVADARAFALTNCGAVTSLKNTARLEKAA